MKNNVALRSIPIAALLTLTLASADAADISSANVLDEAPSWRFEASQQSFRFRDPSVETTGTGTGGTGTGTGGGTKGGRGINRWIVNPEWNWMNSDWKESTGQTR